MQETTAYTTGPFNQYTAIERGEEAAFEPVHDADGNQTLIRTSTGIWQVAYNAENRPVRFVNESAKTVVECMGYFSTYAKDMASLGPHLGIVGGGEQYNNQHVNQTMVCVVFE